MDSAWAEPQPRALYDLIRFSNQGNHYILLSDKAELRDVAALL